MGRGHYAGLVRYDLAKIEKILIDKQKKNRPEGR
jgi:hypothetical protein